MPPPIRPHVRRGLSCCPLQSCSCYYMEQTRCAPTTTTRCSITGLHLISLPSRLVLEILCFVFNIFSQRLRFTFLPQSTGIDSGCITTNAKCKMNFIYNLLERSRVCISSYSVAVVLWSPLGLYYYVSRLTNVQQL